MRTINHIVYLAAIGLLLVPATIFAQDTTLNRSVTVERDFQPIIQSAGIIAQQPEIIEQHSTEPTPVTYSTTSAKPLSPSKNISPLGCSLTTWEQPKPLRGYVGGGIGHTNTVFDFAYRINDTKSKIDFQTFAQHRASWGRYTVSNSSFGLSIAKSWTATQLYFGADAQNRFLSLSGRYVDTTGVMHVQFSKMQPHDYLSFWTVNTHIGLRSMPGKDLQYRVQTGYTAFVGNNAEAVENQIRTIAEITYRTGQHQFGAKAYLYNFLLSVDNAMAIPDSLYSNRHRIHIEPFYQFDANRFHAHIGVNIDLLTGRGQLMSSSPNLAFAPSPNVRLEYDLTRDWLAIYAHAQGNLVEGSLKSYNEAMPYRTLNRGITTKHVPAYTPIDAKLGLIIRPQANLLIDVFGQYQLLRNQRTDIAPMYWELRQTTGNNNLFADYCYSHGSRWTVGAEIRYHYQDIVNILVAGNYYIHSLDSLENSALAAAIRTADGNLPALDAPKWNLQVNVDARINRHWSVFTHNHFAGSRTVVLTDYTTYRTYRLIPTIELNLGAQYDFNKYLNVYCTLNNILHRFNPVYYGYSVPGINFIIGANYKF